MAMRIEDLIKQYNARKDELDRQGTYFIGDITQEEAERFSKAILLMSMERRGDINNPLMVYINSGGGSVGAGFAMIEMMQRVRAVYDVRFHAVITGYAYSMGAIILQAADWRTMGYFSTLMLHSGSWMLSGEDEKIFKDYHKLSNHYQEIITQLFARRTGMHSAGWWHRYIYSGHDRYLSPQECLKLGLVDEIADLQGYPSRPVAAAGPSS